MLLAVDIGNTDVKLGVFRDAELVDIWRLTTDHDRTADEYAIMLQILLSRQALDFSALAGLVMCSSVPSVQDTFAEIARRYLGCEALVVRGTGRTGSHVSPPPIHYVPPPTPVSPALIAQHSSLSTHRSSLFNS